MLKSHGRWHRSYCCFLPCFDLPKRSRVFGRDGQWYQRDHMWLPQIEVPEFSMTSVKLQRHYNIDWLFWKYLYCNCHLHRCRFRVSLKKLSGSIIWWRQGTLHFEDSAHCGEVLCSVLAELSTSQCSFLATILCILLYCYVNLVENTYVNL